MVKHWVSKVVPIAVMALSVQTASAQDLLGQITRPIQQVVTGTNDAVQIITAPLQAPNRIVQDVVPGVHINPMNPLQPPTFTSPEQARRNLERLPDTINNNLNPLASQLADAIRRGEERSALSAQPVPAFVRNALSGQVSEAVLQRARFTTNWGEAQNATIQQFLIANDYAVAVTLNRVIVFDSPDSALSRTPETIALWRHELTHIEQYMNYDIDGFAYRYVNDAGDRLESEARRNERSVRVDVDALAETVSFERVRARDNNRVMWGDSSRSVEPTASRWSGSNDSARRPSRRVSQDIPDDSRSVSRYTSMPRSFNAAPPMPMGPTMVRCFLPNGMVSNPFPGYPGAGCMTPLGPGTSR